ncbi:MAG: hypothetical protein LBJ46_07390 [Planctomycetota bacterium]|nr:hypothetical protein [Planctomycetota bacterium]
MLRVLLPILAFAATALGVDVTVALRDDPEAGVLEPSLFGGNLQWIERGDGVMEDGALWNMEKLEAVRRLRPPLVRFPGGALASAYDWERGVGGGAQRGTGSDAPGGPQTMHFGTLEYLDFLHRAGAEGMITLNLNKDPETSAGWLRFVKEMGPGFEPASAVPWWEVGNESYLRTDPSFCTAEEYVGRFAGHYGRLKAVDREARVGAILEANFLGLPWVKPIIPENDSWNDTVIEGLKARGIAADFYGIHFYALFDADLSHRKNIQTLLVAPAVIGDKIARLRRTLRERGADAPVFVTEFNIFMKDPVTNWKYCLDPVQAPYMMDMLMTFAQTGVRGACVWSLLGNWNFGLYGEDYPYTMKKPGVSGYRPGAEAYMKLADYRGREMLATEIDAPDARFDPVGIVTAADKMKVMNAVGLKPRAPGEGPVLLVVNRSAGETLALRCDWNGRGAVPVAAESVARPPAKGPKIAKGAVTLPPMCAAIITYAP